jgi:hypothetical protein
VSATEIGTTFTQAMFVRVKPWTLANSGASGGEYCGEEEEELEIEGATLTLTLKIDKTMIALFLLYVFYNRSWPIYIQMT